MFFTFAVAGAGAAGHVAGDEVQPATRMRPINPAAISVKKYVECVRKSPVPKRIIVNALITSIHQPHT